MKRIIAIASLSAALLGGSTAVANAAPAPQVAIPNVVDMNGNTALALLQADGFNVRVVGGIAGLNDGCAVGTNPTGSARYGSKLTLFVSLACPL